MELNTLDTSHYIKGSFSDVPTTQFYHIQTDFALK